MLHCSAYHDHKIGVKRGDLLFACSSPLILPQLEPSPEISDLFPHADQLLDLLSHVSRLLQGLVVVDLCQGDLR